MIRLIGGVGVGNDVKRVDVRHFTALRGTIMRSIRSTNARRRRKLDRIVTPGLRLVSRETQDGHVTVRIAGNGPLPSLRNRHVRDAHFIHIRLT